MINFSEETARELEQILANYSNMFSDVEAEEDIMKTFRFEKGLAEIEVHNQKIETIEEFINELRDFFFINKVSFDSEHPSVFSGSLYISRFRNIFDAMMIFGRKHNGLLDAFADLCGIFFGYSFKEVAEYCSAERLKKFNLIKI